MRMVKPSRSQFVAALLLPAILLVLAVLCVIALMLQGRPFLYTSERMRDARTPFRLYKIRTMTPVEGATEMALGGHQHHRITKLGRLLRRTRLDELPQIFNVLKGDIGFIGPRPPLRRHVEACPRAYREVLQAMRPGVTGLSTVLLHRREERLLAKCRSAAETEAVYVTQCLPLKLRIDMVYAHRRGLGLDFMILQRTAARLICRDRLLSGIGPRMAVSVPTLKVALPKTDAVRPPVRASGAAKAA